MTDREEAGGRTPGTGVTAAPAGAARFEALRSGTVLRHYVVEEVIGAGGFGITYRARHATLKSKVFALKEYFPREFAARAGTHVVSTADGEGIFRWGLDRFLKEAEALAKCEHSAIVDVVDYFEANGTAYAVLGYVEGQQLGQWLSALGRSPTQAELDRILMPLLDALEVVHGAKLLHRDIAPDNILVRRDGTPCLIDFGASREDVRDRSRKVSAIVKHGYSPPEQYHGLAELQGPWTDIYAVGATMYRAIAGTPPMDSSRRGALGDALKPVSDMTKVDYRPGFMKAIDASLALKPEQRPQSVAEWREMLMTEQARTSPSPKDEKRDRGEKRGPPTPSPSPSPIPVPPPPPRWRTPVLVAGALTLLVGSAGAYKLLIEPPPSLRTDPPKPKPVQPEPPKIDPEQAAREAWTRLASSTDAAAIERYLAEHGSTTAAGEARRRLATLRDETAKARAGEQEAKAKADRDRAAAEQRAREQADRAKADRDRADAAARIKTEEDRKAQAEIAARLAWAQIATSGDAATIERFLTQHGSTSLGETARARLAVLGLEAGRARERDAQWQACQAAAEAAREAACTPVIDGDDTAVRRASALHLRGVVRRKANRLDDAIADLDQALRLMPGPAGVYNDRGIARFLKGDQSGAMADYTEAIRLDPSHAEALNNRAWTMLQAGNAQAALADADRSIRADAGKAYAYDTRGHIYEALGRRDDAIRDYERALALDPGQEDSQRALDRLRGRR
ncbi:MAG: tetratricopeptide repeat protein [Hyphomicrobiaceae bacterium]|nr:tetratricopeptide repeat protein [Hyphomicrobiaceae bacterium]